MSAKWLYALAALMSLAAGMAARYSWLPNDVPMIPEPQLVDLQGKAHALSEWRGKVLILNFWAVWCAPCREEMPEFVKLQTDLQEQGIQFVGVAVDDPGQVQAYLRQYPVNYPILLTEDEAAAWAERLGDTMAALPFSVVFDRQGRQVYSRIGTFRREQVLEVVAPLLGSGSSATPQKW